MSWKCSIKEEQREERLDGGEGRVESKDSL